MLDKFDKNKNPFTVPENYFQGLTQDIMNNLPTQEKEVKKVVLWKKVLPWVAVAAMVTVVVISTNLFGDMPQMMAQDRNGQKMSPSQDRMVANEIDDYFLFLEDEATEAEYIDVLFEE